MSFYQFIYDAIRINFERDYIDAIVRLMTLIGCWRFTGTPTQNGVVTVGNNETTPLRSDSLLGEFTKPSESRISETTARGEVQNTERSYGSDK